MPGLKKTRALGRDYKPERGPAFDHIPGHGNHVPRHIDRQNIVERKNDQQEQGRLGRERQPENRSNSGNAQYHTNIMDQNIPQKYEYQNGDNRDGEVHRRIYERAGDYLRTGKNHKNQEELKRELGDSFVFRSKNKERWHDDDKQGV